jgi:hypothetical protein
VQDTCPAPGSVCRTQNWRPAPPKAAKIELEKPKSISRGVRKKFGARFSLAKFWVGPSCRQARPCKGGYGLAELARRSAVLFVERFLQCKMTAVRSWSRSQEPDRLATRPDEDRRLVPLCNCNMSRTKFTQLDARESPAKVRSRGRRWRHIR